MTGQSRERTLADWLFVPRGDALPAVDDVGGKGLHLARLEALATSSGFRIPAFVVLRAAAFTASVSDATEPDAWLAQLQALACPAGVRAALDEALARFPAGSLLAVRSSASLEDGAQRSFAGQFESVLGVRVDAEHSDALWQAVRRVWASAAAARALAYRGDARGPAMAVVIQEMVDAEVAGVVFSSDPVLGHRDTVVLSAVLGLGEGLVSGELDADTWRIRFAAGVPCQAEAMLAKKTHAVRLVASGGTRLEEVPPALRDAPALRDDEALAIARVARRIAEASDAPQDIEWALAGPARELVVLQARPITALAAPTAPSVPWVDARDHERHLWDNSNIIESYGGVTTPLTFTFARSVYEDVYRQFCRLLGNPESLIASHEAVFANMLGLVRGRVYYDLLNWYRTLALLPGFTWNRAFMEKMMGVREALLDAPAPPGTGSRLRDLWMLVRMLVRLVREARRLRHTVPAFHARIERALEPVTNADLEHWPAARALELYRKLEIELLRHWETPLVNDFLAMIFFGALGRLVERWLPDSPPTLVNDLLCGEGGIVSTEPSRRLMDMARRIEAEPVLRAELLEERDTPLLSRLGELPGGAELRAALRAYVERFGDRCMEELKLETITLREDPSFLLHTLRAYLANGRLDPDAAWRHERAVREAAERRVDAKLRGVRRWVFHFVLDRARRRVRDRENLRFERTRVFGVVRRIFLALGAELAHRGAIETARDVFMLTRDEVFAASAPAPAPPDLRGVVAGRRAEFDRYAKEPPPPDRFESIGPPTGREWQTPVAARGDARVAELSGTGCCPGVVRAPVRVVRDPRQARDLEGHILVAERTDPGWTVLFPAVVGLLVQRGSLLSHSAIVAREMGIPCVVGIAGLLDALADGELVEMDGTTGVVRRAVAGA